MVKKIADILLWALFFIMCACTNPLSIQSLEESEYIDTLGSNIVVVKQKKITTANNNVYEVKIVTSVSDKFIEGRYFGIENNELTFCKIYSAEDSLFVKRLYVNPLHYDR